MVFVIVDPVVMLATSVTTTSRMFPVLANTSVTSTDVTPLFPILVQVCKAISDEYGYSWIGRCKFALSGVCKRLLTESKI